MKTPFQSLPWLSIKGMTWPLMAIIDALAERHLQTERMGPETDQAVSHKAVKDTSMPRLAGEGHGGDTLGNRKHVDARPRT